jgi:hypothetical protein
MCWEGKFTILLVNRYLDLYSGPMRSGKHGDVRGIGLAVQGASALRQEAPGIIRA